MPDFYCTWPTTWPDLGLLSAKKSEPSSPVCWERFDSREDRLVHYETAHPDLLAAGFEPRPIEPELVTEVVTSPARSDEVTDPAATWRCPAHGCTAPLSRHPVELAAIAARSAPSVLTWVSELVPSR